MAKSKGITLAALIICILTIATASAAEPGSNSDPVVSKSYVDARINEVKSLINGNTNINTNTQQNSTTTNTTTNTTNGDTQKIVDEVLAVVQVLYGDKIDKLDKSINSEEEQAFVPVELNEGQILIGGEGAEIIFRSGKARAYSENEMGLIDVSSGTELFSGDSIEPNHLLIVGRNDGRGAIALEHSWFTVKGGFTIK